MNIYELLVEYKNLTIVMIDKITQEEEVDELINKRQSILDKFKTMEIDKVQMRAYIHDLKILEYEMQLEKFIEIKKSNSYKEFIKAKKSRIAYNQYNKFNSVATVVNVKK